MSFTLIALLLALAMFAAILTLIEIGRRIGIAWLVRVPDGLAKGVGASEGAVFGLMGLMIAFTFSGAATRFETRKHLVAEEVNDIGTAYLRINVLPEEAQPELRDLLRRYLDLRITTYASVEDEAATQVRLTETEALQKSIWLKAVAACHRPDVQGRPETLLLPALNAMFDITTTRKAAALNHPPLAIFLMLGGLSLVSSLLVGYGTAANTLRPWLHAVAFATIMSVAIYVIVDLEFPRLGLIRVDAADQSMIDLRKSLN